MGNIYNYTPLEIELKENYKKDLVHFFIGFITLLSISYFIYEKIR